MARTEGAGSAVRTDLSNVPGVVSAGRRAAENAGETGRHVGLPLLDMGVGGGAAALHGRDPSRP